MTPPRESEDQLAQLIRLADQPAPISSETTSRVKLAVHAHWREQVRQRRRKRILWTTAGIAAAATVVLTVGLTLWSGTPLQPISVGRIAALASPAWVRSPEDTAEDMPLRVGQTVGIGFEVRTGEGRVALLLNDGKSVRLDVNTRLRVLSETALALDRGMVYIDSGRQHQRTGSVEIQTAAGVIREIGTQFEVRADEGSVRIRVREGSVVLETGTDSHHLAVGTELNVTSTGAVRRSEVLTYGPDWGWTGAIAPMMTLEGRSAREFLDWASRERGWELRFSDETVRRAASRIILSGSAEGLTLGRALDAVLPTCRMNYEVQDGILLVSSAGVQGE